MPEPEAQSDFPPIPAFSRADPHPSGGFIGEDWRGLLRTRAKDLVFAAKHEFRNAGRRPQIACRVLRQLLRIQRGMHDQRPCQAAIASTCSSGSWITAAPSYN